MLVAGCKSAYQVRDPEYAQVAYSMRQPWNAADPASSAMSPVYSALEGPHPVEDYIQFALNQNPDIQAARKRLESVANEVPVAASLQDPMLGVTAFPSPVQTAAGQQELLLTASQKLPWFGKLNTRASVAEAQTDVARRDKLRMRPIQRRFAEGELAKRMPHRSARQLDRPQRQITCPMESKADGAFMMTQPVFRQLVTATR